MTKEKLGACLRYVIYLSIKNLVKLTNNFTIIQTNLQIKNVIKNIDIFICCVSILIYLLFIISYRHNKSICSVIELELIKILLAFNGVKLSK